MQSSTFKQVLDKELSLSRGGPELLTKAQAVQKLGWVAKSVARRLATAVLWVHI
jgi:hypothetical protein